MKKQYLLFAGDDYYPQGGCWDFKGSFNSIEEAVTAHDPNEFEYKGGWANIFCLVEEKEVLRFERGEWIKPSRK
jgi:hypothetical protein